MTLTKKPMNGMKDILPAEMRIRDYLISMIKETYGSFGFTSIETPVVESLGNLMSKQGGDNEKLIFKVLKRGEKLRINEAETEEDLSDSGLRYDLTVPLVRFFSNNENELQRPFKALQIGPVFRADRPQRGRFREFYQCDIDIIGEPGNLAETELILATSTLLERIGFKGFTIKINDREILKSMAAYCGFCPEDYDKVFIILDKMDKIGLEGVVSEIENSGLGEHASKKTKELFEELKNSEMPLEMLESILADHIDKSVIENLKTIIRCAGNASGIYNLEFDPTLVRGMGYYTGPVFEIKIGDFGSSVGGGGRYDKMIEKFTGQDIPACGFSIGFERIITILLEQGYKVPDKKRTAYLIEKNMPADRLLEIISEAQEERKTGIEVSMVTMAKNKKFQKTRLEAEGVTGFKEFYINPIL